MQIKSFKASKVYGYLEYNIHFNGDLSLLVGGNGSGKTTALKLMNALLGPNFGTLLQIPYKSIQVICTDKGIEYEISAVVEDNTIAISISTIKDILTIPSGKTVEFEYFSHNAEKYERFIDEIASKSGDHPVVRAIMGIESPIFLGLERRPDEGIKSVGNYYDERERSFAHRKVREVLARRLITGSLGMSLIETELLVQNAYNRLREIEERHTKKLQDAILLSAFQYVSFSPEDLDAIKKRAWSQKQGVLNRNKEIRDALSKMGVTSENLATGIDKFFHQINELFESLSEKDDGLSIEWLLNKSQIDRVLTIVETIDEHKSSVDSLFKPINDFLNTINKFFEDSKKRLEINKVGQLVVRKPDGTKCTIEGLSSGERQILVIFAYSFFRDSKKGETTFIIDEPELSLHLKWQEMFVPTLMQTNSKAQFILATHSPEIVGEYKNKAMRCCNVA